MLDPPRQSFDSSIKIGSEPKKAVLQNWSVILPALGGIAILSDDDDASSVEL